MNLTALNNITPFEVNNTLINQTSDMGANLVTNANTSTGGYFGLGVMVIIFIFLMIILMADQEIFRLSFSSALLFSSAVVLLLGIVLLVGDLISNFQHVMWFAIIFLLALLIKYYEQ